MNKGITPSEDARAGTCTMTLPISNVSFEALAELLRENTLIYHLNGVRIRFVLPDGTAETYTVYPCASSAEYSERIDQLNWSNH